MIIRIASMIIHFNADLLISSFAKLLVHVSTLCALIEMNKTRFSYHAICWAQANQSYPWQFSHPVDVFIGKATSSIMRLFTSSSSFLIVFNNFLLVFMMKLFEIANCYCAEDGKVSILFLDKSRLWEFPSISLHGYGNDPINDRV